MAAFFMHPDTHTSHARIALAFGTSSISLLVALHVHAQEISRAPQLEVSKRNCFSGSKADSEQPGQV